MTTLWPMLQLLERVSLGVEHSPSLFLHGGCCRRAPDNGRRRADRARDQVALRHFAHLVCGAGQEAVPEELPGVVSEPRGEQSRAPGRRSKWGVQGLEGAQVCFLKLRRCDVALCRSPLSSAPECGDRLGGVGVAVAGEAKAAREGRGGGPAAIRASLLTDLTVKERGAQSVTEEVERGRILVDIRHSDKAAGAVVGLRFIATENPQLSHRRGRMSSRARSKWVMLHKGPGIPMQNRAIDHRIDAPGLGRPQRCGRVRGRRPRALRPGWLHPEMLQLRPP